MPRRKKEKLIGLGLPANLLKEFIDYSYLGNTSIAPEGYDIDAPLSDSRVKVYAKKGSNDKNIVIVHRGSVGKQDWFDNIDYFLRGKVKTTKTFKLHRERQLKAVEKYGGENIIGLGHSRAGLYLQEMQKDPATKLGEIITYNKAVGFYDALRENPEEQTDVKVKNDFVSLLSGLQKRPNKMVEIDATSNPLDFNKAHQPAEIDKLGDTFIGKKEEIEGGKFFDDPLPIQAMRYASNKTGLLGSGRAPSPKTLDQLKKTLKTLEGKLEKINKGKVYKTTNKDKVSYEISYTKARITNHETKGEDLIITKKAKYKDELPAKAKPYKAKAVKPKKEVKMEIVDIKPEPKKEEPKKEEPKKEEPKPKPEPPKLEKQKAFLLGYKEIKEEPKKEVKIEVKQEVKQEVKPKTKAKKTANEIKEEFTKIFLEGDLEFINDALHNKQIEPQEDILISDDRMKRMKQLQIKYFRSKETKEQFINEYNSLDNCEDLMCKHGINSKDEFRKWVLKNHPDKGGNITDTEFKQILKCAGKKKYCSKKMKEEPKKEDLPVLDEPNLNNVLLKMRTMDFSKMAKPDLIKYYKKIAPNHKIEGGEQYSKPQLRKMINRVVTNYFEKMEGGYFWDSKETKEAKKASREAFEKEKQEKKKASRKELGEALTTFATKLNEIKQKKKATTAPKADTTAITTESIAEDKEQKELELEGGWFWDSKEVKEEKKAKVKAAREARAERFNGKKKPKAITAPKADDTMQMAMADDSIQQGIEEGQQGIEEGEPMAGAGYYLDKIAYPINPVYNYRNYDTIPSIIESEDEFLMGGGFTDMAGMNCDKTTGQCFNPVWEKQKIKRQILSEYKIWYWPWGEPPAGHIRMAWLEPMIQERYKPLYDEFVARRNVNIGLPADASKDRFAKQMFSNLTDGLSYVPVFNTVTSLGLSAASSLTDTKKEDGT